MLRAQITSIRSRVTPKERRSAIEVDLHTKKSKAVLASLVGTDLPSCPVRVPFGPGAKVGHSARHPAPKGTRYAHKAHRHTRVDQQKSVSDVSDYA